ncbi:MAG: hypothetical protein J6P61_10345 [Erysipelotrichaceae bacterium]|nr:hypothetical protein [Erysipelotrichaceae bacterium]
MSDRRRRTNDNTTDFFLNFIKEEKKKSSEVEEHKKEIIQKRNQTMGFVARVVNTANRILDHMLSSTRSLKLLSLMLTLFLFFSFTGDSLSSTSSGRIIRNVEVNIEGLEEGYSISGVPETVSIGLIGPAININATRISTNYSVYIDLSGMTSGTHTVPIKTKNFSTSLSVWILPETATVTIEEKRTTTFDIKYQLLNTEDLNDEYDVKVTNLSDDTAEVNAGTSQLNRINYLQIAIDAKRKTNDFTQECNVIAYDANGDPVECSIDPKTVTAEVSIEPYKKTVAIKPEFTGKVKKGYKMTGYKLSPTTVTLYGKRTEISNISSVSCEVDISDLNHTKTISSIPLTIDSHVTRASTKSIDVTVTIDKK